MSHPYIFHANFEAGDNSEFDSETDASSQLSVAHFTTLAREGLTPFSGAYCARINVTAAADAYLQEDNDFDIAADTTRHASFNVLFANDFTATGDDTNNILEFHSGGGGTIEAAVTMRIVSSTGAINLGIRRTGAANFSLENIQRNVWYTVEVEVHLDDGPTNDGTIDLYVTPEGAEPSTTSAATQVTGLNQSVVDTARFGLITPAATTSGTMLLDNLIFDDTRIFPRRPFEESFALFKTEHVALGPGCLRFALDAGNADNELRVYDSNSAQAHEGNLRLSVDGGGDAHVIERDVNVARGAYCVISGTAPHATVFRKSGHFSRASIKQLGLRV